MVHTNGSSCSYRIYADSWDWCHRKSRYVFIWLTICAYYRFLDYTDTERERLALKSVDFICDICGPVRDLLKQDNEEESEVKTEIEKYSKELTVSKPADKKDTSEAENNNAGKRIC